MKRFRIFGFLYINRFHFHSNSRQLNRLTHNSTVRFVTTRKFVKSRCMCNLKIHNFFELCLYFRDKERNIGFIQCRVCLEDFQCTTNALSEAIDVYAVSLLHHCLHLMGSNIAPNFSLGWMHVNRQMHSAIMVDWRSNYIHTSLVICALTIYILIILLRYHIIIDFGSSLLSVWIIYCLPSFYF